MANLNKFDDNLRVIIHRILNTGYMDENPRAKYQSDNSPANTISVRGGVYEMYDIANNEFPISLTRPCAWKSAINEVLVFYQDQSNRIEDFKKRKVHWWSEWDIGDDTIGQRYGATIKRYDLLNQLLDGLKNDPFSKRHLIDMYQYTDLRESDGLHPCFFLTMWSVSVVNNEKYLDLTLIGRSSDELVAGIGVNHVQYVALQMMIAKHLGYKVGLFEVYRKNVHIYSRHIEQLEITYQRLNELKNRDEIKQPKLILNVEDGTNFYDITIDDFELVDYEPMKPQLKFDLGV